MENLGKLLDKIKYFVLAAVGLYAMKDKEEGDKVGVPNVLKVAYYKAKIVLQNAYDRISGSIGRTVAIAYICVAGAGVLIMTGAIIGSLGAETVGHGIIVIGGLFAASLAIFTWIRFAFLVEIVRQTSKAIGLVTETIQPISEEVATKLVRNLATVAAWLTFISLYLSVLPVWHSLIKMGIALLVFLFFGAVLLAGWFQSNAARYMACITAFIILILVTVSIAFPSLEKTVVGLADSLGNDMSGWTDKNAAIEKIEIEATQKSQQTDQNLLIQLYAAQNAIKERALKCGGQFCNDLDKAAFVGLASQIEKLKDGTYWNQQAGVPPKPNMIQQVAKAMAPKTTAAQPSAQTTASTTAELPPPADVPRMDPPSEKSHGSYHDAAMRNSLCTKYPYLKACQD